MSSSNSQAKQIRLLLVEDVAQVGQFVKGLLDAQSHIKLLDTITDGTLVVEQMRELLPDVVIVDALLRGKMDGLQVAEQIRLAGFDVPIVCLTVPQKPVSVGEGMGLAAVLSMPFSGFDFINLIKELHDSHLQTTPGAMSRVYAIFGAKGGVGTTTLAYNIAASIASAGHHSVALVDGSFQFADLRALLRVDESVPSIVQLPTSKLTQADLSDVAWRDKSGMDIFFAPPRPEMAEMITAVDVTKLLALLRRVYNIVVLDTATSVGEVNLALLDAADQIVVLLAYEEATLRQSKQTVATLSKIGYPPDKLLFLVTRSDASGGIKPEAIDALFGRPADFAVVSDGPLVLAANNSGEAFALAAPTAQISRDVAAVAAALSAPRQLLAAARR
ncbi:response regulator [soil metagenome]